MCFWRWCLIRIFAASICWCIIGMSEPRGTRSPHAITRVFTSSFPGSWRSAFFCNTHGAGHAAPCRARVFLSKEFAVAICCIAGWLCSFGFSHWRFCRVAALCFSGFCCSLAAGIDQLCWAFRIDAQTFGRRRLWACLAAAFMECGASGVQLVVDQSAASFWPSLQTRSPLSLVANLPVLGGTATGVWLSYHGHDGDVFLAISPVYEPSGAALAQDVLSGECGLDPK